MGSTAFGNWGVRFGIGAAWRSAAVAVLAAFASASAQDPPPQPTFRSGIDLVTVDVGVVDADGNPVRGLTRDDFTLEVDGQPRTLVSVEYISYTVPDGPKPGPAPAHYSSNENTPLGRLILLVVDQANIRAGEGRAVMAAARRFLDRLTPADRVGLAVIPELGARIGFTTDHRAIQEALTRVVGQATPYEGRFNIGLAEALAIEKNDAQTLRDVVARECATNPGPDCAGSVEIEAGDQARHYLTQTRISVSTMRALIDDLRFIPGPKTMVLLSEGLVADYSLHEFERLGLSALSARVNIYVLKLDVPRFDASTPRLSPSATQDDRAREEGLEHLAGTARGAYFRVMSDGDYAFRRIARELAGHYLLAFEPQGTDRNGKLHKIRVRVGRPGVTLRARSEFAAGPNAAIAAAHPAALPAGGGELDQLKTLLEAPLTATELPLRVTSYVFQDPGGSRLKLVVAAEADTSSASGLMVGFLLLDRKGNIRARGAERTTSPRYAGTTLVEPGHYTLKFAAVDSSGRRGSVERQVPALLISSADFRLGDLMLAEPGELSGMPSRPAIDGVASDRLLAYLELYATALDRLAAAEVVMEVARAEDGPALISQRADTSRPQDGRRIAQSLLPIRLLPPGVYVTRAIIRAGDQSIARLARPFRVQRAIGLVEPSGAREDGAHPPDAGGAPADRSSRRPALAPLRPDVPRYAREDALRPPFLEFFLGQAAKSAGPLSPPIGEAIEQARRQQFDRVLATVPADPTQVARQEERVMALFLRGLAAYAGGNLDLASRTFNVILQVSPDFPGALAYLGACYAAAGRDGEAVGAWQTSLSQDAEAPPVFHLLAEALFRQNQGGDALAVLEEARERWPDRADFEYPLAIAYAMTARYDEALAAVERHLARAPADVDALFLAMRLIYEAHLAGRPLTTGTGDRERLVRYAEAYTKASGPRAPVVEQWVRFVSGEKK